MGWQQANGYAVFLETGTIAEDTKGFAVTLTHSDIRAIMVSFKEGFHRYMVITEDSVEFFHTRSDAIRDRAGKGHVVFKVSQYHGGFAKLPSATDRIEVSAREIDGGWLLVAKNGCYLATFNDYLSLISFVNANNMFVTSTVNK